MRHRIVSLVGIAMLGLGLAIVGSAVAEQGPAHVLAQLGRIPTWRLGLSAACAAGSYGCLTGFDFLGVRWSGRRLPYPRVAFASFVSLSLGHNIGLGALGSGTLRYRLYSTWGLGLGEVARVVVFSGLTVLLGLVTLGGVTLLVVPDALGIGRGAGRVGGVLALLAVAGYLAVARYARAQATIPGPRLATAQVALGVANFLCEAAVLYQVIAAFGGPGYLAVVAVFVVAALAGLASHSPGGLGVIEAVVLALMPGTDVVPALIAYRAIYYWVPGLLGATLLAGFEWRRRRASPSLSAPPAAA